ncbi:uncharacterized protein LOC122242212 isoform X2 [Penaeus japonicus]|uniref:uncharacterized protein LOC122242212 isoform X2 n=1 Tax=Penaeus japonicus TaxID=27405 RepID=UPI001C71695E|nr:uncharacterized protein LOC122242212 isoform X2 [Penaeus japonicus]
MERAGNLFESPLTGVQGAPWTQEPPQRTFLHAHYPLDHAFDPAREGHFDANTSRRRRTVAEGFWKDSLPGDRGTLFCNGDWRQGGLSCPEALAEEVLLGRRAAGRRTREPGRTVAEEARSRNRKRDPQMHAFLLGLLSDPATNPSLVRWENVLEFSFVLVVRSEVARCYEDRRRMRRLPSPGVYFERVLRYHCNSGYLVRLPDRDHFKFGPRAFGCRI